MKKIMLTGLLFFFFFFAVVAQEIKPRFSSINSIGFAAGESSPGLVLETVNGIKFSNWFAGIGIGMDDYRYKSIPLFLEGRMFFGEDKKGFIYGDLGYNFTGKNKPGNEIFNYDSYHFSGGSYLALGVGFNLPLYKKSTVQFSVGYSYKKMSDKIGVHICPFVGPCNIDYSRYEFGFGRLILKAGVAF
ncbi:MAG: hypothetical protein ABIP35_06740 [Ginsengibacter sp.]